MPRPKNMTDFHQIYSPVKGLLYKTPSTMMTNEHTPNCEEVKFKDGTVEKHHGTSYYGGTAQTPAADAVMLLGHGINGAGTNKLYAHTLTQFYDVAAGALTARRDAAFTGGETDYYSFVNYTNLYIFSNGKDKIRTHDLGAGNCADLAGATTYFPNWINVFGEALNLYGVKEVATNYPVRVRYAVPGDSTDWAGTGSGATDLRTQLKDGDEIIRAEPLGDVMIIYGRKSIATQKFQSSNADQPYIFNGACDGTGLLGARAIVNLDGCEHLILGQGPTVYSYKGGRSALPIGKNIESAMRAEMDMTTIGQSWMQYIPELNIVRLYWPTVTRPNKYFELCLKNMAWSRGTRTTTGGGRYAPAGAIPLSFMANNSGEIFKEDTTVWNHDGAVIDGYWETKDFVAGKEYRDSVSNWFAFNFEAKGNGTLILSYSTDAGATWTVAADSPVTLTTAMLPYSINFAVNSTQFRMRLRNNVSAKWFAFQQGEVGFSPGSRRGT